MYNEKRINIEITFSCQMINYVLYRFFYFNE